MAFSTTTPALPGKRHHRKWKRPICPVSQLVVLLERPPSAPCPRHPTLPAVFPPPPPTSRGSSLSPLWGGQRRALPGATLAQDHGRTNRNETERQESRSQSRGPGTYSRSLSLSEDLPTCIILCMPPLLRGIRAPPSNFWGLTGNRALGGLGDRGPSGAKAVELAEAFGDINWETGTFGRYSGAALYPDATSGEGGSALRCASCSLAAQPALFIGGFRYGGRGGQSHRTEAFVAGLFYLLFWPFSWNKYDLAPSKFSHACGESYRPAHGKSGGRRHLSTNWMSTGRR